MLVGHHFYFARCLAELNHGYDLLALGLQIHAVIVKPDDALHRTCEHFIFGIYARTFVKQFDVNAFGLEIAQSFGQLGWKVNLLFIAAHNDGDFVCGIGG